jgi:aspartokinase-like uncharacterized kinase
MAQAPLVLKVGGSLLESGRLARVLSIVAKRTRPVVLVPGGGKFADEVRRSQAEHGFDDAAAHRLALFAMHQMANVIATRSPHFVPASSREEIGAVGASGLIPVWLPAAMAGEDQSIPKTWDMTSDSLAAWLAAWIGAPDVALVKSCVVEPAATLEELGAAGIVDPLFETYVTRHRLHWSVIGEGEERRLHQLVAPDGGTG